MLDGLNTYWAICWVDSVKCASIGRIHKLSINKQLMRHLYGHVVHIHVNLNKKIKIDTLNPDEAKTLINQLLSNVLTVLQLNSSCPPPRYLRTDNRTKSPYLKLKILTCINTLTFLLKKTHTHTFSPKLKRTISQLNT